MDRSSRHGVSTVIITVTPTSVLPEQDLAMPSGTVWTDFDFANADFILLISAHLESGHYFNPHAQRIIEGKNNGTKIAVMDIRLSNTDSRADYWMATYPGTEAAVVWRWRGSSFRKNSTMKSSSGIGSTGRTGSRRNI